MLKTLVLSFGLLFISSAQTLAAQTSHDTPSALISPAQLQKQLQHPQLRILDIRSPDAYAQGHITGAVNTPYGKYRGPADNAGALRTEAELSELFSQAGISPDSYVVVSYEGANPTDFGAAARVYWTLKAGGLQQLSILDGGIQAWLAADGQLDQHPTPITPTQFSYQYNPSMLINTADLAQAIEQGNAPVLIDARPEPFFKGQQRVDAAARYGTLPGARDLDFNAFFNTDAPTLKSAAELTALVQKAGLNHAPTVSFCNTGHWAATNWFVLSELVGNPDVKLYPESIVEWSKTDRPMDNQPSRFQALKLDAQRAIK